MNAHFENAPILPTLTSLEWKAMLESMFECNQNSKPILLTGGYRDAKLTDEAIHWSTSHIVGANQIDAAANISDMVVVPRARWDKLIRSVIEANTTIRDIWQQILRTMKAFSREFIDQHLQDNPSFDLR